MANIWRLSKIQSLRAEGFRLGDALRIAYSDLYYNNKYLIGISDLIKGLILSAPFLLVIFNL